MPHSSSDAGPHAFFTPIYYVNGAPHVGHAYTTIATDMMARFARLQGQEVYFQVGTDEHGAKNAEKAAELGMTPQAFVDENAAKFSALWDRLQITHDTFWRTTSSEHKERVQVILQRLFDNGVLYEADYTGLYCVGCEKFLTEKELDDEGCCPDHKTVPKEVSETNWFFRLSDYLPRIEELIRSDALLVRPVHMKSEVLGLFQQGMDDFSVSRQQVDWGITLPFAQDQTTYVWVEALCNYITGLGYGSADDAALEAFWPGIQVIGKDILKFHAVYWPALLLALELKPPREVFAHGFFTVDGQKMSKTIGNVVDPHVLVDRYGSDAARFLILTQFPFGQDGDIKASQFDQQYNTVLANDVGNVVHRITSMTQNYLGGSVEISSNAFWESTVGALVKEVETSLQKAFSDRRPDQAWTSLLSLVSHLNASIESHQPWVLAKDETKQDELTQLFAEYLGGLAHLSLLLLPFLPEASTTLAHRLSLPVLVNERKAYLQEKIFSISVEVGDPLFPRIQSDA